MGKSINICSQLVDGLYLLQPSPNNPTDTIQINNSNMSQKVLQYFGNMRYNSAAPSAFAEVVVVREMTYLGVHSECGCVLCAGCWQ